MQVGIATRPEACFRFATAKASDQFDPPDIDPDAIKRWDATIAERRKRGDSAWQLNESPSPPASEPSKPPSTDERSGARSFYIAHLTQRRQPFDELDQLVKRYDLAICGIVWMEVLRGRSVVRRALRDPAFSQPHAGGMAARRAGLAWEWITAERSFRRPLSPSRPARSSTALPCSPSTSIFARSWGCSSPISCEPWAQPRCVVAPAIADSLSADGAACRAVRRATST